MLKKWLSALGMPENWIWSKDKKVCSQHFDQADFKLIGPGSFLKEQAVPSLQLPTLVFAHVVPLEEQSSVLTVQDDHSLPSTSTNVVPLEEQSSILSVQDDQSLPSTSAQLSNTIVSVSTDLSVTSSISSTEKTKMKKRKIVKRKIRYLIKIFFKLFFNK